MKNIEQIQSLTRQAIQKREENKKIRAAKEAARKVREKKERVEQIKKDVLEFYPEEIEKAAKAGKFKYAIGFAIMNDGKLSADGKLTKKYIEQYLKEFNPTFRVVTRTGYDYDWEGCPTSSHTYEEMEVKFTW